MKRDYVKVSMAEKYGVSRHHLSQTLKTFFLENMGCSRKVYNLYVEYLYDELEKTGYEKGDEIPEISFPNVTEFKNRKGFEYLKKADSIALSNARMAFIDAWERFQKATNHDSYTKRAVRRNASGTEPLSFRGLKGMPKFHAKSRGHFSYKTNCQYPNGKNPTVRLTGNMLHIPKAPKKIPLILHRPLPEDAVIKSVTVSMDTDGQFYVSITYEYRIAIDTTLQDAVMSGDETMLKDLHFLGLDYSQQHFYVDSEGRIANYPHYYRKMEEKLARKHRKLSRMEQGSKNYTRQKKKVARLHRKVRNQRKDFINKEVFWLVNAYDVICVEDIDLRAMSQCLSLGKNLMDNGFGMFRTKLSQKLEKKGSVLVKIDRWYPSSKTCSCCGSVNDEVQLGVSEWTCPECRAHHDRDVNGAINIMQEGRRIFPEYFRDRIEKAVRDEQRREKARQARLAKRWNKETDSTAA